MNVSSLCNRCSLFFFTETRLVKVLTNVIHCKIYDFSHFFQYILVLFPTGDNIFFWWHWIFCKTNSFTKIHSVLYVKVIFSFRTKVWILLWCQKFSRAIYSQNDFKLCNICRTILKSIYFELKYLWKLIVFRPKKVWISIRD